MSTSSPYSIESSVITGSTSSEFPQIASLSPYEFTGASSEQLSHTDPSFYFDHSPTRYSSTQHPNAQQSRPHFDLPTGQHSVQAVKDIFNPNGCVYGVGNLHKSTSLYYSNDACTPSAPEDLYQVSEYFGAILRETLVPNNPISVNEFPYQTEFIAMPSSDKFQANHRQQNRSAMTNNLCHMEEVQQHTTLGATVLPPAPFS